MPLSSATPFPIAFTSATLPAAYARTRPGTPTRLSGRKISGSRNASSTRRYTTSTARSPPPGGLRVDAVAFDEQVAPLHELAADPPREEAVLEVGGVVRARREQHAL